MPATGGVIVADRCNTCAERLGRCFIFEGLSGTLAKLSCYSIEFGLADRQKDVVVAIDTPFFYASQGKMITAVSILQLVEAGELDLNAPLGEYLTDYPNEAMAKVTTRQ